MTAQEATKLFELSRRDGKMDTSHIELSIVLLEIERSVKSQSNTIQIGGYLTESTKEALVALGYEVSQGLTRQLAQYTIIVCGFGRYTNDLQK